MPRKGRKNISHVKQKKALATRLIQISLIMDDYIYKHVQVSEHDAKSYIVEISSFKNKCDDDPRSLQVIEKLIIFMKAIINDHQESKGTLPISSNTTEITSEAACVSPIYSLIDDDQGHLTQSIPEEKNAILLEVNNFGEIDYREETNNMHCQEINNTENEDGNKSTLNLLGLDSENKETSKINNSQNISNSYQEIESQDIFSIDTQVENKTTNIDYSHCTPRTELNAENEYLNTEPEKSKYFREIDYSQSILTNVDNVEDQMNLHSQSDYTSDFQSELNKSKTIENVKITNALPKEQVHMYANKVNYKKSVKRNQESINLAKKKITDFSLDSMNTSVKNIVKPTLKTISNNGDKIKNSKVPHKRKSNVKSQENVKAKEVKRKPRKEKDQVKTDNEKSSCDNKMDSSISHEKSIDLSWVENLKYVREISTAESHTRPKDLSSSFWENYLLPNDWDDSEFDYKT